MKRIMRQFQKKTAWLVLILLFALEPLIPACAQQNTPNSGNATNPKVFVPVITSNPTATSKAGVYYLSPNGDDNKSGATPAEAWKTFNRAVDASSPGTKLKPGETLILMDGIYYQSLTPNNIGGQPGNPITIMAQNDGKAIIDGQNVRIPVFLENWRNASYFVIRGIVARNSSGAVYETTADNNTFQRVSGYNAKTNDNQHVFIIWANNTLLEDCIASGSGRKMVVVFSSINANGQNNTVRRCFANYREWDGKDWHDEWPDNSNFEVYSGDHNIFENDIAYSAFPGSGFSLLGNGPTDDNIGNKILGSMAIMGGSDLEGNAINWGTIRPQPSQYALIKDHTNPSVRVGFIIWHDGIIKDDLLQDILAWGNDGIGLRVDGTQAMSNNVVNRATIINNGVDLSYGASGKGIDAFHEDLTKLTITNSQISKIKSSGYPYSLSQPVTGEGARLKYKYINGILKDGSDGTAAQPLWPWPMEDRIRNELGISVTNLAASITQKAQLATPVSAMADTASIYTGAFLSPTPISIPFGNVKLGTSANQPVTLKNLGTALLSVTSYQFDSTGSTRFSVAAGGTCPQLPYNLNPGQSCTVNVAFTPQDFTAQTTYLTIVSPQAPLYPKSVRVYLSGLGYGTSGTNNLPEKVQAEAFTASGGSFQVKPTIDDGGSAKIAGADAGVWLTIPVNNTLSGNYTISARVASINNGGNSVKLTLDLDGTTIATFYPPNTGSWDTFTDVTVTNVNIPQGAHTLKINYVTGGFDLNYINFIHQ
jgi:hypothetical protein